MYYTSSMYFKFTLVSKNTFLFCREKNELRM